MDTGVSSVISKDKKIIVSTGIRLLSKTQWEFLSHFTCSPNNNKKDQVALKSMNRTESMME